MQDIILENLTMQDIILRDRDLSFRSREAYRTLRSNIEFSGKNVRTIAITSCTPDEGKSEVSFELSRSFAQNKQRVLLIDADMRKSVMASSVQKGRIRYGLSNFLIGQCSLEQCICRTNLDGLYMIFSGPSTPTPSELLGSEAFDQLLSECRKLYDYIVVDTPPLGSVIDSAIIGKQCDGVILVIGSGSISYTFAQDVKEQLVKANCHILGTVLNKVHMDSKGYYGKYYGKYYGNYYGKDSEKEGI